MIRLSNSATDLLSLITAQNGAKVVVCFADYTTSAYTPNPPQVTSITSATTTTIASTPASSTVRDIDEINIKNTFAGSHTMTVQMSTGGTLYPMLTFTLLTDESMNYTHGTGWCAIDANGNRKEATANSFSTLSVVNLTTTGATTEVPRMAAYQWTTWNPSDVVGTTTNAPGTSIATIAATSYITMANSSGTVTFTFSKAGNYLINVSIGFEANNNYTAATTRAGFTFGGTATTLYTNPASGLTAIGWVSSNNGTQTRTFSIIATASQTLTVLPKGGVVGSGATTDFIFSANATATYTGT